MMLRQRTLDVVTNGVLDGPSNAALDRRLLARVAGDRSHGVLRLYRFTPTVSVGRHQALARELRLDYCRNRGTGIIRRLSGGGALYLDQNQTGFSLAVPAAAVWCNVPLAQLLLKLACVVARALQLLDIAAYAAPPNDVEVAGRKIASVYVTRRAGTALMQGIVLLDTDIKAMLEALRAPTEKLTAEGLATARKRFVAVAELRGSPPPAAEVEAALIAGFERMLGARARRRTIAELAGPASAAEHDVERQFANRITWEADDGAIESVTKTAASVTLRARAVFAAGGSVLQRVELATDAHLEPAEFLGELEDVLAGMPVALLARAVHHRLHRRAVQTCGFAGSDIVDLLQQLVIKERLRHAHRFSTRQVNAVMLYNPGGEPDLATLLSRATVMLLPYCAKPVWCKWRHRDGCSECGKCEVGEAYRFARSRNMQVTTITNYEHLVDTLRGMKQRAVAAYIGMCCANFFVKRQRAFAQAGIPALLMDVSGANCYDLKQEEEAYAGTFRAEAKIDCELLARLAAFVPRAAAPLEPGRH